MLKGVSRKLFSALSTTIIHVVKFPLEILQKALYVVLRAGKHTKYRITTIEKTHAEVFARADFLV